MITAETKKKLVKQYGGSEKNTGSTQAQIALLTERIQHITTHLKVSKKDFASEKSLTKMVGQRKQLLKYLQNTELQTYRKLIEQLNIRK